MRSTWRRIVRASSRHSAKSSGCRAEAGRWAGLFDDRISDVRIPLEALQPESVQPDGLEERACLARPDRVVQLVEGEHRALRHSRQKMLKSRFRRLVQIAIHEQHADNQVAVA